jgi:hypothetical protein
MTPAFGLALLAATSTAAEAALVARVLAGAGPLPPLAAVQEAAVAALALTPFDEVEGWARRARLGALLPRLDVRVGTDVALDVRSTPSGSGWTTSGLGRGLDLAASWSLSELAFSDRELRAHRERVARAAIERLARERATRLYFRRLEILLEAAREPTVELLVEGAQLDGLLRAVTAGRLERPAEVKR